MEEKEVVQVPKLAMALSLAQAMMKAAPKNKVNPFYKSKYADLDGVWDACREPLTKNGLSVAQFVTTAGSIVTVSTILLHSSGESLRSDLSMKAKDESPQAIGSTITYGRRYGLSAMVGISSDDDDDGNATHNGNKSVEIKFITKDQVNFLIDNLLDVNIEVSRFLAFMKLDKLENMPTTDYQKAVAAIDAKRLKEKK